MICSIDGCDAVVKSRGWCIKHYTRWRSHGDPMFTLFDMSVRLWGRIAEPPSGCWLWLGNTTRNGYGQISMGGRKTQRMHMTHRLVWELLVGEIPTGLELDHLCRQRSCCNPAHLEPVTRRENLVRGKTIIADAVGRTHCIHGHEFTPENTYLDRRGKRGCRECRAASCRRYEERKKACR